MSESFWESEAVKEHPESQTQPEEYAQAVEPGPLALSADDFSALEDRILRAVSLVKRERAARNAAEERAGRAEAQLGEQAPLVEQMQKELTALRSERDQVRQRIERLLGQLDALEL